MLPAKGAFRHTIETAFELSIGRECEEIQRGTKLILPCLLCLARHRGRKRHRFQLHDTVKQVQKRDRGRQSECRNLPGILKALFAAVWQWHCSVSPTPSDIGIDLQTVTSKRPSPCLRKAGDPQKGGFPVCGEFYESHLC